MKPRIKHGLNSLWEIIKHKCLYGMVVFWSSFVKHKCGRKAYQKRLFSNFNRSLDTAHCLMHKLYTVIIPCATPYTLARQSPTNCRNQGSGDAGIADSHNKSPGRQCVLLHLYPEAHPPPLGWDNNATWLFSCNKSFSSSEREKDIARSSLRPMGTPLQTSRHAATPQTPSLWSVFPAALSVTVWLVLLRSPSPASFRCHLFCTRWLLPSNPALPSYLAPGSRPYPKVLTQVLSAGRGRVSLLLLWQARGCL